MCCCDLVERGDVFGVVEALAVAWVLELRGMRSAACVIMRASVGDDQIRHARDVLESTLLADVVDGDQAAVVFDEG
jgi:hypothetical protein